VESEAGVIASLIVNPELSFYSDHLLPNHFQDEENKYLYAALRYLAEHNIKNVDAYNIVEALTASEATKGFPHSLTVEKIQDTIDMADVIARQSAEEYKMLVNNVMDAAFRRDTFARLKRCQELCFKRSIKDVEQQIYKELDEVMMEFSTTGEIPEYKDQVDMYWEEIKARQGAGYAGYPFKFPTLNEFATIERGELFIFGAEQKQGKSMMLLNCAVDLLKQDLAVLYIDSELNTRMFTARLLAHLSGVAYKDLTAGRYTPEEEQRIIEAKEWMKTRKFTHIYIPLFDQQTIYTAVKKTYHTQGLDVLIVDYFKSAASGDAWDSYAELGRLVDMVKNELAGKLNIAAIGAAQATSTGKLADSAKIARNASTIAMITDKTPEEIEADGPECGNKKLRVVINRNGMQMGPQEWLDLRFDGNHILYEEAKQHIPTEPF
jgi:replicative DNA helicase